MKNKTLLILILLFLTFCFIVFFKGLKNSNIYIPETAQNKDLEVFSSKDLFTGNQVLFDQIFINSEFYILNIWASWCLPLQK